MSAVASPGVIPHGFAEEWVAAWNAHDLPRILEHYAPQIVFTSPVAQALTGCGVVEGKEALAAYWQKGLARAPELHFVLDACLEGSSAVTLLYRNHRGERAAETCEFDGQGKVVRSYACYGPAG